MKLIAICTLACFLSACASYSLVDTNGNKVSGSMMNGAASISSGAACAPTAPTPEQPPPALPAQAPLAQRLVCDTAGQHCVPALMALKVDSGPICQTSVVNVRGADLTTLFQWALAGAGIGFLLAK